MRSGDRRLEAQRGHDVSGDRDRWVLNESGFRRGRAGAAGGGKGREFPGGARVRRANVSPVRNWWAIASLILAGVPPLLFLIHAVTDSVGWIFLLSWWVSLLCSFLAIFLGDMWGRVPGSGQGLAVVGLFLGVMELLALAYFALLLGLGAFPPGSSGPIVLP